MKSGDSLSPPCPVSARSALTLFALGSVAFTLVGSLVPFEFRPRPISEISDSFVWAMTNRIAVQSRSDGIANVLLGVPLGFALLGIACVDRCRSWVPTAIRLSIALVGSMAFAASVEFLQLYAPLRTCCASDVIAQGVGALIGMCVWVAIGQRWINSVRGAASGAGAVGQFFLAAIVLLAFTQVLPFDLSLSPYGAYYKFRDGGVQPIPLREFQISRGEASWARSAEMVKLAALYLPVGLLAGGLSTRFRALRQVGSVALAAGALAVALETAQVFVKSKAVSATEAIIGAGAAFFGWWLADRRSDRGWPRGLRAALLAGWLAALAVTSFQPFILAEATRPFDWVPGSTFLAGNPLVALDEMLAKLVLFGLGGALVASAGFGKTNVSVLAPALCAGLIVSAACEAAQCSMIDHSPSVTDVILGGVGALGGAWITMTTRVANRNAGAHTDG